MLEERDARIAVLEAENVGLRERTIEECAKVCDALYSQWLMADKQSPGTFSAEAGKAVSFQLGKDIRALAGAQPSAAAQEDGHG